jgi:diaminopimelate epimerase
MDHRSAMRFEKWEALGNDFVLVDAEAARSAQGADRIGPDWARQLCDRRRGVGADGVLLVDELDAEHPSMVILNADGSRAQMCGNGLRCVVGHLARRRGWSTGPVAVQTDAGLRRCQLTRSSGARFEVEVGMGTARIERAFAFDHGSRPFEFVRVDVGNPHAVTFDQGAVELVDELGAAVDRATPGGCNVEACVARDGGQRLDVVVFERGVGRTLACGTGASAAAAAAVAAGRCPASAPLEVTLPGGALQIVVEGEAASGAYGVRLTGPAKLVFAGTLTDG